MAEKLHFTKPAIERIATPPKGKRSYFIDTNPKSVDCRGFGLTVTSAGSKVFTLTRYVKPSMNDQGQVTGGQTLRFKLGTFPDTTVEQARKRAIDMVREHISAGLNPREESRRAEREKAELARKEALARELDAQRDMTIEDVFEEYINSNSKLKASTKTDYRKVLMESWSDYWEMPMRRITEEMVFERHKERSKTSEARADYAARVLRALFNYATVNFYVYSGDQKEYIFATNPVRVLADRRAWNKPNRRETYISPKRLKDWYDVVTNLDKRHAVGRDYFLFLLFTGARRGEAASIRAVDIDQKENTFTLRDTKNRKDVTIPMSKYVAKLVKRRLKANGEECEFLFPANTKEGHVVDQRKLIYSVADASGVEWRMHDLRRTFVTYAESLDLSIYVIKSLINHSLNESVDVTAGYYRRDIDRMRNATQRITDYILSLAEAPARGNVVAMRRGG